MGLLNYLSNRKKWKQKNEFSSQANPFVFDSTKDYPRYEFLNSEPIEGQVVTKRFSIMNHDSKQELYEYQFLLPNQFHMVESDRNGVDLVCLYETKQSLGKECPLIVIQYSKETDGSWCSLYANNFEKTLQEVVHPVIKYRYEYEQSFEKKVGFLFLRDSECYLNRYFYEIQLSLPKKDNDDELEHRMFLYLDTIASSMSINKITEEKS